MAKLALVETFTEKELQVWYEYSSSKEGKAIQTKLPQIQERLTPLIEEMMRKAMVQMQKNEIPFR